MGYRRFKDYHEAYLETDVLLLADVFENFRKTCIANYELDPANYITAPSLAWDAMLYKTLSGSSKSPTTKSFRWLKSKNGAGCAS